jgi:hypothetical protein
MNGIHLVGIIDGKRMKPFMSEMKYFLKICIGSLNCLRTGAMESYCAHGKE